MSGIESSEAPEWLSKLESRREKVSRGLGKLGHDSGAGAPCNSCGPGCPGLDLHFWRKTCRSCHCSKDSHDVQEDDVPGWAQFELLGQGTKRAHGPTKIRGFADKLDWVPADVSPDLVSDYMSSLGGLAPVVGSKAAATRREQLRRQVPPHDIRSDLCTHALTPQEKDSHKEYVSQIKNHIVGVGNVVRIGNAGRGEALTVGVAHSRGPESRTLPMRVTLMNRGIKYVSVPKGTTDERLDLDESGNIICRSARLPNFETSPVLSALVKDELRSMGIESDRIKSAVECGPVYDKLFMDLRRLNVPIHADVYLSPIVHFRSKYNADPKFRAETNEFAKSMGADIFPTLSNAYNNNGEFLPLKGTIYGPGGEIWSWKSTQEPNEETAYDEAPPPLPNYSTHPNMQDTSRHYDKEIPSDVSRKGQTEMPIKGNIPQRPSHTDSLGDGLGNLSLDRSNVVQKTLTACSRCKNPVRPGEVGVKAEKAGNDRVWHPQCFTCIKCKQLLADLVYFYHKGEIYCARDLAEALKMSRCAACDELIFSNRYTVAEGKKYHPLHFCCYHCDVPLGDKSYTLDDKTDQPTCMECFDKFDAHVCHSCKKAIGAQQVGVSWPPLHWHGSCFLCANHSCQKSLLQGKFVVKEEKPFCSAVCVRAVLK